MKHSGKLFGYAEVEIRSANMEKTLKTFAESGIYVTRAKRISYTRLECDIDIMSVRRAAKLADIRVIERKGAARCISAIRRHTALLCTAAAGAAIIAAASCMCLEIEVRGAETVSIPDIMETVRENGGRAMIWKKNVDTDAIVLALRRRFPQLSYANAHFDGVKLIVETDEGKAETDAVKSGPCDIVAAKDGVITEITVLRGEAAVGEGSVVRKGDILIRGIYDINDVRMTVAASGIVKAAVVYEGKGEAPCAEGIAVETGNVSEKRMLRLGKRWIHISGGNDFLQYNEERVKTAEAGVHSPLTLEVWKFIYKETKTEPSDEAKEAGKTAAKEAAYYNAVKYMPEDADIINVSYDFAEKDGRITAIGTVMAEENIGCTAQAQQPFEEE